MERLRNLVAACEVEAQVDLYPSLDDARREVLLAGCRAVIYTPQSEHLGLVPLEAMAAGRPVVATQSGGPLETVVDGSTGFLCAPRPQPFAAALARLVSDAAYASDMGLRARRHVETHFALSVFGARLDTIVRELAGLDGTQH
jgi:alpha-1,3/alpha-1,6-mannosyltransferase